MSKKPGGSSGPVAASASTGAGAKGAGGKGSATAAAPATGAAVGGDDWKPVGKKKLKLLFGGIARSSKARVIGDWEVQEWQRLPMLVLQEYCKGKKIPRPNVTLCRVSRYNPTFKQEKQEGEEDDEDEDEDESERSDGSEDESAAAPAAWEYKPYDPNANAGPPRRYRARVRLPDPKRPEKDIIVETHEAFYAQREAEEMTALLVLYQLQPTLPHEKTLPSPFKERWLAMRGAAPPVRAASQFLTQAAQKQHAENKRVARLRVERAREARLQRALDRYASVAMSDPVRRHLEQLLRTIAVLRRGARPHDLAPSSSALVPAGGAGDAARAGVVARALQARLAAEGWSSGDARAAATHTVALAAPATLAQAAIDAAKDANAVTANKHRFGAGVALGEVSTGLELLLEAAVNRLVLEVPESRLPQRYDPRGQQLEVLNHNTTSAGTDTSDTSSLGGDGTPTGTVAGSVEKAVKLGELTADQMRRLRTHVATLRRHAVGDETDFGLGLYDDDNPDDADKDDINDANDDDDEDGAGPEGKGRNGNVSNHGSRGPRGRGGGGGNPFARFLPSAPGRLSAALAEEEEAKRRGATVTFDLIAANAETIVNVKPLLPYIDYFMPSVEEAGAMSGRSTVEDSAKYFLDAGVKCCVFTLGGDGAYYAHADGTRFQLPAYEIDVVDTTGCGDAFDAGFITALHHRMDPETSVRFAQAAAGLVATGLGSDAGIRSFEHTLDCMKMWKVKGR